MAAGVSLRELERLIEDVEPEQETETAGGSTSSRNFERESHVVAFGNAFDGLNLYGPFATYEEAAEWAEDSNNNDGEDWEIVSMGRPKIESESDQLPCVCDSSYCYGNDCKGCKDREDCLKD